MKDDRPKLIVVDDEPDLAGFVSDVAEQAGYLTELFHQAETFKDAYNNDAEVIVLDLLMPGVDGVEVIRHLANINCEARLILMSGFDDSVLHSAQKLAIEHGLNFTGSLSKPFRQRELFELLNSLSISPRQKHESKLDFNFTKEDLHSAIENNDLVIHYQPKIQLLGGNVVGLEALVRWQHGTHGLIYPNNFIPFAEHSGLVDDLTWHVLQQVADQCRKWDRQKLRFPVAVNMSAKTMQELALPERMLELVKNHGLEPRQLILEVTETTLMTELVKSLDILTRLRMKGFKLAIDDFGTGYSSLVQLHRAPFAELKIDASFITDMVSDKEAFTIVETVIALAQKLDMQVVAEGVESQTSLDILTGMGCDMAQGFYICEPKPVSDLNDWLQQHQVRNKY